MVYDEVSGGKRNSTPTANPLYTNMIKGLSTAWRLVPLWIEHDAACGSHPMWAQVVVELGPHNTIISVCTDDLSPHGLLVVFPDDNKSDLLPKIIRSILLVISTLDLEE